MSYTDEEQKKIFAKNLNYYIAKSGKQQKEVAEELGFKNRERREYEKESNRDHGSWTYAGRKEKLF